MDDWNDRTCANAASGGHIKALQWARENGCEWNAMVCSGAAENGHFDVIKWPCVNGCD